MFAAQRRVEEEPLLRHQHDPAPQRRERHLAQVHAVEQDRAAASGPSAG